MSGVKKRRCDDGSETSSVVHSISTAQVQELIAREVQSALKQSDKLMKTLMERIQKVDNEQRYDASLRKLEAHIRKVKRRGDTVFTDLRKHRGSEVSPDRNLASTPEMKTEAKTSTSSANGGIYGSSSSSGDVTGEGGTARKPKEGFWQSLRTMNRLVDLTDGMEACRQNGSEHVDSPQTSSQDNTMMDSRPSSLEGVEIPDPVAMERKTPELDQEAEATLLSSLPPFPHTPFPHQLHVAAASKSMPQKPVVKVARITNPQGIALLWNVEEDDPDAAAMDCYYIYVTQQRSDGTFFKWKTMGVIKAMPLPMACRVAAERSGNKTLCFIIIGKDVYGRYGPYSDVHTVWATKT